MEDISELRFFQLLSKGVQDDTNIHELTTALKELANHLANIALNEGDYAILLRYFSFGLNRLKSLRGQFEQEKKCLFITCR